MVDNTKFGPPKGMRDWLPQETLLRQKLIRLIEHHYQLYGFQPIDTPVMENIEVLQGKGGGENEKLMFKVAKRGEELDRVLATQFKAAENVEKKLENNEYRDPAIRKMSEDLLENFRKQHPDIADMGLRFDLTVPLARYYSNHTNELPKPFRCYHIGPVWRADRPQKGRFREFYQCDIDIVGGTENDYEVELLLATDRVLKALNVGNFKIRISHKFLIPSLLTAYGVDQTTIPKVAAAIDKLDKKPKNEVKNEISELVSPEVLGVIWDNFIEGCFNREPVFLNQMLNDPHGREIDLILGKIRVINPAANVIFDPLLVRGFDYYTGPVFEINVENKEFTFSIGGGGRYNGLIEKLGGPKGTPAVGISLGFERILLILMENKKASTADFRPTVFIAKNNQQEKDIQIIAERLRSEGIQAEVCLEKKDFVKQMKMAQENGFEYAITEFNVENNDFKVRKLSTREDIKMNILELGRVLKGLPKTY